MKRFIFISMVKGLNQLLFETFSYVVGRGATRKRRPYDLRLVEAKLGDVLGSATVVGLITTLGIFTLIVGIKFFENPTLTYQRWFFIAASLFIALGVSQQLVSLAIDVVTASYRQFISKWATVVHILARFGKGGRWDEVTREVNELFTHPSILYSPSEEILATQSSREDLIQHIQEGRGEVHYESTSAYWPDQIFFAEHTINFLRETLMRHDQLYDIEQRIGLTNSIIFIAAGTVFWLLS